MNPLFNKGISRRQMLGGMGAVGALGALALAGCTNPNPGGDGGGEGGGGEGGQTTLHIGVGETDGYDWRIEADNEKSSLTFGDTLLMMNPDTYADEPGLAESWELSPDGLIWTFHLRPDVAFHDDWGTVTAEDVKFTWSKWCQEDADHGSRMIQMRRAIDNNMDNFEVVDDLTFRLHAKEPVVQLLSVLNYAAAGMTVTSKKYFDETDPNTANAHPIGTGPWKFVSSKPKQELVIEAVKSPHPFRSTPKFDRAVLTYIADGAARLAQLQSGTLQLAQLQSDLKGEAEAAGLQLISIKDVGHCDLVLGGQYFGDPHLDTSAPWIQGDTTNSPRGKAIREALSLAIDRQQILDVVLKGDGSVTNGPLMVYAADGPISDPTWSPPVYDPALAKQKLAEGGFPNGFDVEFMLFDADVDTTGVGEAVCGMWEEIGIKVKRTPIEEEVNDEYLKTYNSAGHAWLHIQANNTDPTPQMQSYYPDPTFGDYKWFDPATTTAFEELQTQTDKTKRLEVATGAIGQLRDDIVPISMFSVDLPYAVSADIAAWNPIPILNTISRLEDVEPNQ